MKRRASVQLLGILCNHEFIPLQPWLRGLSCLPCLFKYCTCSAHFYKAGFQWHFQNGYTKQQTVFEAVICNKEHKSVSIIGFVAFWTYGVDFNIQYTINIFIRSTYLFKIQFTWWWNTCYITGGNGEYSFPTNRKVIHEPVPPPKWPGKEPIRAQSFRRGHPPHWSFLFKTLQPTPVWVQGITFSLLLHN